MRIINQFFSRITGSTFCSGAQEAIALLKPNDKLVYVREPDNKYDKNAIMLFTTSTSEQRLGYIPASTAKGLSENLDKGNILEIIVSEVTGGKGGKENFGCNISITIFGEGEEEENTPTGLQMEIGI